VLHIDDDDEYEVGQVVTGYLTVINDKQEYRLCPPHQTPAIDRLRAAGHDV
jgi:hypothetical protein